MLGRLYLLFPGVAVALGAGYIERIQMDTKDCRPHGHCAALLRPPKKIIAVAIHASIIYNISMFLTVKRKLRLDSIVNTPSI